MTLESKPAPELPPPPILTVAQAVLWVVGLFLLVGMLATLASSWITPDAWQYRHERTQADNGGSSSFSYNHGSMGRESRIAQSIVLIGAVVCIAGARAIGARQFSLRTLLIAVLIAGLAGNLPHLAINRPDGFARIAMNVTPFVTPAEAAEIEARLQRDRILETLPPNWKKRLDRVPFTTEVKPRGENGLELTVRFSSEADPADRDSAASFCSYYFQWLIIQRLPGKNRNLLPDTKGSEWTRTAQKEWEASMLKTDSEKK